MQRMRGLAVRLRRIVAPCQRDAALEVASPLSIDNPLTLFGC